MSKRVTFDAKKIIAAEKAGDTRRLSGYLANIKGAYAEDLARKEIVGPAIKELSHVNKGGVDFAVKNGNMLDIVEAKARQSLSKKDLKNYIITDSNGVVKKFNADYVVNDLGDEFLNPKNQKRFVLYLNGPDSTDIMKKLNLPDRIPYMYKNSDTGEEVSGTIDIVVMAMNK